MECLETNALNISNILTKILLGFEKRETLILGENEIFGDLAGSWAGRIFTLRLPLKIGPNDEETQFFLFLAPAFVNVMLHDPNFFIFNDNPYGLPTVTTIFDAATMFSHYHRIALSEIQELDLTSDPCNNDQSYNFNSCVRRSLARQVKHRRWQSSIFYRWVARPYGTDGMDQEFPTVQLENNTGAKILGTILYGCPIQKH